VASSKFVINEEKLQSACDRLTNLYRQIPDTTGCLENIKKEGGCCAWCCQIQTPQLLYCEFRRAIAHITKTWEPDQIIGLLEKALRTYLSDNITKGCIMFDDKNHLCRCHAVRPYNCYCYGISPRKEFAERVERIKAQYAGSKKLAIFKDQCDLIQTMDGRKEVSTQEIDDWWKQLVEIEKSIGIKEKMITDEPGGAYRTFHDHLLIYLLPGYMMENLSVVRQHGDNFEKDNLVKKFVEIFKKAFSNNLNNDTTGSTTKE